jgi:hypothetical protein
MRAYGSVMEVAGVGMIMRLPEAKANCGLV